MSPASIGWNRGFSTPGKRAATSHVERLSSIAMMMFPWLIVFENMMASFARGRTSATLDDRRLH